MLPIDFYKYLSLWIPNDIRGFRTIFVYESELSSELVAIGKRSTKSHRLRVVIPRASDDHVE